VQAWVGPSSSWALVVVSEVVRASVFRTQAGQAWIASQAATSSFSLPVAPRVAVEAASSAIDEKFSHVTLERADGGMGFIAVANPSGRDGDLMGARIGVQARGEQHSCVVTMTASSHYLYTGRGAHAHYISLLGILEEHIRELVSSASGMSGGS
jgi:hypothetical protein